MDENTQVDANAGTTPAPEAPVTEPSAPSQDPIQAELDREDGKKQHTPAEKAAFALRKNAESVRELGLDPAEVLGIAPPAPAPHVPSGDDDDQPVTMGMLKRMSIEQSQNTALALADAIEDPKERELTKKYLQERVVPSGDPEEDLRFARSAVLSVKNGQMAALATAPRPASHSSAAGAPATTSHEPTVNDLSAEEKQFMQPPFNLTVQEIVSKRKK